MLGMATGPKYCGLHTSKSCPGVVRQSALIASRLNVTFNREAIGAECHTTPGQIFDVCKPSYFGPVAIPSIGVEGFY